MFLSGTIALVADSDADGVVDNAYNCIDRPNPAQLDSDADGIGNYCDGDFDNNCRSTLTDLSIMQAGFFTINPLLDLDGSGGPVSFIDLAIMQDLFFLPPDPSGIPNLCN